MKGGENMDTSVKKVGVVTHYYNKIGVGIIKCEEEIKTGDKLRFEGHETKFDQDIKELQFDHKMIETAKKGQEVGIKLDQRVRENDLVYKIG